MKFKGYLVRENEGNFNGSIEDIDIPKLEQGRVLIKVHYSSLNYKDALAASGAKGVASSYPFVPGIDVAGEIIESSTPDFSVGDNVIATGYKIGMSEFGGFGEIVHLPSNWVIKMPSELDYIKCMSFGTAGITAAACIKKIADGELSQALKFCAERNGINLNNEVINYLTTRETRIFNKLFLLIKEIDLLSAQEKRKITVPFVKEMLNRIN